MTKQQTGGLLERVSRGVQESWTGLPHLVTLKFISFWYVHNHPYQKLLILLSLLGLFAPIRQEERIVFIALLVASSAAVMVSHNHNAGRFLVPLHPMFYALSGLSLVTILRNLKRIVFPYFIRPVI